MRSASRSASSRAQLSSGGRYIISSIQLLPPGARAGSPPGNGGVEEVGPAAGELPVHVDEVVDRWQAGRGATWGAGLRATRAPHPAVPSQLALSPARAAAGAPSFLSPSSHRLPSAPCLRSWLGPPQRSAPLTVLVRFDLASG